MDSWDPLVWTTLSIVLPIFMLSVIWYHGHLSDQRAVRLLRSLLAENEFRQLTTHGYLEVASPSTAGRVYRIPRGLGRVAVYDGGEKTVELCLQPEKPLPLGDVILLHKLLIQANESYYLATANHFRPGAYPQSLMALPFWF
ncbi:MAG TPA: hypothetical protein VMV29_07465 [Ktedonobacterales bacterium]|nr:hypothetical protein [Ktedonobacterales bacterium]